MKIPTNLFRHKYGTESKKRIIAGRLKYATSKYGVPGEQPEEAEDYAKLEYLDAIECQLQDMVRRIDEKRADPKTQEMIDTPWNSENVDEAEETLAYLVSLLDRLDVMMDFAETKLQYFYRHRGMFCVHRWAEELEKYIILLRHKYGKERKNLKAVLARRLAEFDVED